MKRIVDRALVIFPFEAAIYRDAGIPVEFVGHPLLDLTPASPGRNALASGVGARRRGASRGAPAGEPAE